MIGTQYSQLFRAACHLLKYFFIGAFGFAIALVLSTTLGAFPIASMMLMLIGPWLMRSAIVVACFMAVAMILESVRQ
jgi:hypothetical protein